jgi:hypothetical protein
MDAGARPDRPAVGHPKGTDMKYIIVPLLVALAGWGIRPALADDIHDAPAETKQAYATAVDLSKLK